MKVVIIPARFASTRLPGKPLLSIDGHSMIWHVYQRCRQARLIDAVWVATDDERIFQEVSSWGGKVSMTRPDHPSGTDRVAELAAGLEAEIIINVQGDEPLMDPSVIDALVEALDNSPKAGIATPVTRITSAEELFDPTIAKVVRDIEGYALYFSRAPVPYGRDHAIFAGNATGTSNLEGIEDLADLPLYRHVGVYAYRRETLFDFCNLSPSSLEKTEKLEQLRALENGIPILTVEVAYSGIGVDTEADLKRVEQVIQATRQNE